MTFPSFIVTYLLASGSDPTFRAFLQLPIQSLLQPVHVFGAEVEAIIPTLQFSPQAVCGHVSGSEAKELLVDRRGDDNSRVLEEEREDLRAALA